MLPLRLIALLVALASLVAAVGALLFAGPHSDIPGQPATGLTVAVAFLAGGVALARALWRRRRGAAWGIAAWAGGVGLVALGLATTIASPAERVEARPALLGGLALWTVVTVALTRYVRRRVAAA